MRMMNKSAVREIRHTLGRFMAILAIIALGVGFFSGVKVTTPAMVSMMDDYLRDSGFYDLRLVSTIGWDKDCTETFSQQDGVVCAEGSLTFDVVYEDGESNENVFRTHLLPENVNQIDLCDGRLPENARECVSEDGCFSVGDVITVSKSNKDDVTDVLSGSFTVVGLARSSYYINFERGTTSAGNGSVAGFIYLPEEAFDTDYYTEVFVRFDNKDMIYSDEYADFIDAKTDEWEKLSENQADKRYQRIISEAREEVDKAESELDDKRSEGQKELDDAKKELDDASEKLGSSKKELDDAKKDIESGQKQLDDAKSELENGRAELADAKYQLDSTEEMLAESDAQLTEAESRIEDGKKQLEAGALQLDSKETELNAGKQKLEAEEKAFYEKYGAALTVIDTLPPEQQVMLKAGLAKIEETKKQLEQGSIELEAAKKQLDEKRSELEKNAAEVSAARAEYNEGLTQYEDGLEEYLSGLYEIEKGEDKYTSSLSELEDGRKKYEEGSSEYEKGKKEYEDGLAEYEDGKREFDEKIADAEKEIADAKKEIDDIKKPEVFVLDRNTNIGYACFESDSKIVGQIAKVFPLFFILVAALVCMTTMTRMVEEQRTQIGMFKALGYSEAAVMGRYVLYSGSAALIGCVIGFGIGTVMFPAIIWNTYKMMYLPIDIPYLFDPKLAAAALTVSLLCSIGTTCVSCRYELSETAANLMRPKAPKPGKRVLLERVGFIWKRLKFMQKVSIRNIFRYKGRFFMMMVGIGGCTALLLTGFGIEDSVAGFADDQYDRVQTADAAASFKSEKESAVCSMLDEKTGDYILCHTSSWDLMYGKKVKSINLQTMESFDNVSGFMKFNTMDGKKLEPPKLGEALVSYSVAERYGAKKGTEIVLRDEDMRELRLKVAGVFENYVYNYVYIGAETYEAQLSEAPGMNCAYINFPDGTDVSQAAASVADDENVTALTLFRDVKIRMRNMMESLDYVVLLVIMCAAGLAFIVIYNLTNINITERSREIATIKVLGFFRKETSAYVLRENIFLTAVGIAFGLGLGVLLHRFVMSQIVVDMVAFRIAIKPQSFLFSILLTFIFNFAVNIFMELKLGRINMTESLKSVD